MMPCPKCGTPSPRDAVECARCGIVFAKFAGRAPAAPAVVASAAVAPPPAVPVDPVERLIWAGRAALLAGLLVWTWQFARAPMGVAVMDSVLHMPNLVFHEAGHVLFAIFGRFASVLGGSLFQFALPLALAGVFLKQHDQVGAAVCTWWAGQNLLDLAPYIADARALQLVLLGGKTGAEVEGHDWEYLLNEMGWLRFDRDLGMAAHRTGLFIMVAALVWGAIYLARTRNAPPLTVEAAGGQ
jgi:hypothetical protein